VPILQRKEAAEIIEVEKKHSVALQNVKDRKEKFEQVLAKLSRPITDAQMEKFSNYIYKRVQMRRLEKQQVLENSVAAELEPPSGETSEKSTLSQGDEEENKIEGTKGERDEEAIQADP